MRARKMARWVATMSVWGRDSRLDNMRPTRRHRDTPEIRAATNKAGVGSVSGRDGGSSVLSSSKSESSKLCGGAVSTSASSISVGKPTWVDRPASTWDIKPHSRRRISPSKGVSRPAGSEDASRW